MTIAPLTLQVYEFIRTYWQETGMSPTLREIATGCYASPSTIMRHLDRLEGMGWIMREMSKPRSIRIGEHAPDYRPVE